MNRPRFPDNPEPPELPPGASEDFMLLAERKLRERAVEGRFKELEGNFPFSALERISPLNLDAAPQVVEGALGDIPWGTPGASRQVANSTVPAGSLWNKALLACLDEPEMEQSERVFGMLDDYVKELPCDLLGLPTSDGVAGLQKIELLACALAMVEQKESFWRRAFGSQGISPTMQEFASTLEEHIGQVGNKIRSSLDCSPLGVMALLDAYFALVQTQEEMLTTAKRKRTKFLPARRDMPVELFKLMADVRLSEGLTHLIYTNIEEPLMGRWDYSQQSWRWPEVNKVIGAFTLLQARATQVLVIEALEDAGEVELGPMLVSPEEIAVEGLAAVMHADIYGNSHGLQTARELFFVGDDIDSDVTFGDIVLPRGRVPAATVTLLEDMALKLPDGDFEGVLGRIQELIYRKPSLVPTSGDEWLLALALLRNYPESQVGGKVDAFIDRDNFPHQRFREIIANRLPGYISLTPKGKIRADETVSSGVILAASSAVRQEGTDSSPAGNMELVSHVEPPKGRQIVRGQEPTRRRRRKEKARQEENNKPEQETVVHPGEGRPSVVFDGDEHLSEVSEVSPVDLDIVRQALADYHAFGRHRLEFLRSRTSDGALRAKMRLNGQANGIRIIMTHVGGMRFVVESIKYRGSAYKKLPK